MVFIFNNIKINSKYNLNDNEFFMKITNIKIDDKKITLTLDGKEKLIGIYYYKNLDEIKNISYGKTVYLKGNLKVPSNNTIPYTFNYKKYLEKKHINYLLSIKSIKVVDDDSGLYTIKNFISKRIDKIDNSGYMKAFILGDKSLIDEEDYSNYQGIGITHLFAISGMHIGLLTEILIRILKRLKKGLKYLIIDVILVSYGFIVCFPSSIKRCILFYILNSLNKVYDLGLSSKQVLFITIVLLILFDPFIVYDVGFLFSICTVGGILLCSDYIQDENKFKGAFKLSLVAFLFSLPISLYAFYEINILSIFYNLVFIPFISLIVYPLSLLSFIFPFIYKLFSLSLKILEWSSNLLSSFKVLNIYMSFNIWEVLLFYLGLYMIFIKQHKLLICLLFMVVILDYLIPYMDPCDYVYFLDVNQGDASLIITKNRKEVILLDTGGLTDSNVSDRYIPLLKYLGIKNIDYLILTHGDFDHMGDAIYVSNVFTIKNVIFNCGEFNDLEQSYIKYLDNKNIKYFSCIDKLELSNNTFYFLNTNIYDSENDNSNVIYTKFNNYDFLFMGDAEVAKEKDLVSSYDLSKIDILKVGHHGSKTSSTKEFISKIKPIYSIISVGKYNKYGHPNKKVLENLKDSKTYRTDQDGSVLITIGKRFKINSYNP